MLLRITSCSDLGSRKLMDIYSESNAENAEDFYPGETDKDVALCKVETGFMSFLEQEFSHGQRPPAGSGRKTDCGSAR